MLAAITKVSMVIIWIIITPYAPEDRSRKSKPPINLLGEVPFEISRVLVGNT